jgi:hypothetical protein
MLPAVELEREVCSSHTIGMSASDVGTNVKQLTTEKRSEGTHQRYHFPFGPVKA